MNLDRSGYLDLSLIGQHDIYAAFNQMDASNPVYMLRINGVSLTIFNLPFLPRTLEWIRKNLITADYIRAKLRKAEADTDDDANDAEHQAGYIAALKELVGEP